MTPEPHHKKIYLTFFNKKKCVFIQLLANAPVLLIIKHNALSVNPDSQNRHTVLCLSCPASELIRNPEGLYYDAALQFDDMIAYRKGVIESGKGP